MKTKLEILKEVKFGFDIQSDSSTRCIGYQALCKQIEELESNPTTEEQESAGQWRKDEAYELGKKEVGYDRQLAVLGKPNADSVLYFWLKGYHKAMHSFKSNGSGGEKYSREELIVHLRSYREFAWVNGSSLSDLNKWITENLK